MHEGIVPENVEAAGFVPLRVRRGDVVVLHGLVDHVSLPNTSPHPRHSFQLHIVEGPGGGVTWRPSNWLQYPKGVPFPPAFAGDRAAAPAATTAPAASVDTSSGDGDAAEEL
eukprot:TRINITY_DN9463_c0_g1_i1.p3 TRINITY_DN9463_c0_g1~~TRINITY_DN9463_c0_g1_i1.p3  ORF type:complete len:112 (-),score=22.00 TRINITY_DN9463_c0_g1_i1:405-740(-)